MAASRLEPDLLLLHAPSVYDFREHAILYGPVSDMVPSSTVFEMYPLGFLTIASYLHDRGLDVRIVNLALRMMNDRRFDVPAFSPASVRRLSVSTCTGCRTPTVRWRWRGSSRRRTRTCRSSWVACRRPISTAS